jgi:hypothetical protein
MSMTEMDYNIQMQRWGTQAHVDELIRIKNSTDDLAQSANQATKAFMANDAAGKQGANNIASSAPRIV